VSVSLRFLGLETVGSHRQVEVMPASTVFDPSKVRRSEAATKGANHECLRRIGGFGEGRRLQVAASESILMV
jgi:hypothetical protein